MSWNLFPRIGGTLNWTWVVELIVCICLVNWFLFYFNRVFATLVSYGLRAYTWRTFRVWIDIQALQISLLGGRIFFKGIRYHGENETIFIQQGYITWRYYLRSTRQANLLRPVQKRQKKADDGTSTVNSSSADDQDESEAEVAQPSDARIAINVTGLEWVVYNRTPAYDAIIAAANKSTVSAQGDTLWNARTSSRESQEPEQKPRKNWFKAKQEKTAAALRQTAADRQKARADEVSITSAQSRDENHEDAQSVNSEAEIREAPVNAFHSLILAALPVGVEVNRGAVLLGNESTRAIVVTTFTKAKGHIDGGPAEDKDIYRQIFDFEIDHPVVQMKPNPDFRHSQLSAAKRIIQGLDSPNIKRRWWQFSFNFRRRRHQAAHHLRRLTPGFRGSVESFRQASYSGQSHNSYKAFGADSDEGNVWYGLDRYLDENDRDDHEAWSHVDYARFSTIVDCPAIHFNFYWDVQGPLPEADGVESGQVPSYDLNGDVPPGYGMNLIVRGGDINYGPWADRLRLEIQSAFFPNGYKNAVPAEAPAPGDLRIYTIMNIRVDIDGDVTLRVPTREQSKDWQWRGRAHAVREAALLRRQRERRTHFRFRRNAKKTAAPEIRPFGWFSFTVGSETTVNYDMAMVPDSEGYRNALHMHVVNARAESSVNHALLWRCPSHKISCDLSYPIGWNDMHEWTFNVESDNLEMFLLRDHMFLLTDLIGDFTAGQKADFMTFVPYNYNIGLVFNDLKLYLNANDFNIIDSPTNLDENAYLILGFKLLNGNVGIPMRYFAPRQSQVLFKANGNSAYLDISSPGWNTMRTFLADDEYIPDLKTMATLKGLGMDGSYNYYTSIAPNLSDSLLMTITGFGPRFHLHGFLIRYFMNIKENYFGDHLHFRTLEEYQDLIDKGRPETAAQQRPIKKENDLDVILTVRADQISILIPSNIYTRRSGVRADVLMVEADMRFTNYYMDLQVNSSPIEASVETINGPGEKPDITSTQVFIENVVIFGHRLFGAPPTEPTYSCHWDIDVGFISGQCSSEFLRKLVQGVQSLIFTIDDFENALPNLLLTQIHDVNFVRARAAGIKLWILSETAAFLAEVSPLKVDFDDWAGRDFAKHIDIDVPGILIAAAELKSALRHHESPGHEVDTFGLFKTSLRLATLDKTENLARTRALQQAHIRFSDQRTHRVSWLLHKPAGHHGTKSEHRSEWSRNPPSMPTPVMPEPILGFEDLAEHGLGAKIPYRSRSFLSSHASLHSVERKGHGRSRPHGARSTFLDGSIGCNGPSLERAGGPGSRGRSLGATSITLSSPWTAPHFTLQDAVPSSADMPETVLLSTTTMQRHPKPFPTAEEEPIEGQEEGHMGLILSLEQGLVGFCTPSLLAGVAGLVDELQPKTSLDRLDGVQQDVIALVMQKLRPMSGSKKFDLDIRLPHAHIRFINGGEIQHIPPLIYRDQYDIKLVRGRADVRFITKQMVEDVDRPITHGLLIYTALDSLSITVSDNCASPSSAPARAGLTISKLGIWFSSMEQLRGMVQVADIGTEIAASKLDQMAQLIHRTSTMIEGLVDTFSNLDDSLKTRHLVYHLTQAATVASDPVFLARPSYVLRSSGDHVRSSESWKILVRLRHIYTCSSRESSGQFEDCACSTIELQDGARQQMMRAFEEWRAWDFVPSHKVPVMAALFGQDVRVDGSTTAWRYICLEFAMGRISLTLDPGPSQSDLVLADLEFAASFDPGFRGLAQSGDTKLILKSYMSELGINLNWELVELISNLMSMIRSNKRQTGQIPQQTTAPPQVLDRFSIDAVLCTELTSISLQSPSLKLQLGAENLNTYALVALPAGGALRAFSTVTTQVAMARLTGLTREILVWKLIQPKVSGSLTPLASEDEVENRSSILRLGAACDKLRFRLKEGAPFVMKVIHAVVDHEVAEVHRLFLSNPPAAPQRPRLERTKPKLPNKVEFHVTMFLEDYKLDFVLLPALRYGIYGKVARTSVIPRGKGNMIINFDLKSHEHAFRGVWDSSYEKPATLQIPPINGQVSVSVNERSTTLGVHTAIEQIVFEAAAVRACFDVINQPGFINATKGIQSDANLAQSKINDLFATDTPARGGGNAPKRPTVLRFAADATLAGLRIQCHAPCRNEIDATADLNFEIGPTAIRIHNMVKGSLRIYEKPQFLVSVREVSLGLYRKTQYSRLNYGKFTTNVRISSVTETDDKNNQLQVYNVASQVVQLDLYEETATLGLDIATFLQDRIKSITISEEAKNLKPIRRLTMAHISERNAAALKPEDEPIEDDASTHLFDSVVALNVNAIQVRWGLHDSTMLSPGRSLEDLVFSIRKVDLQTRQEGSARLSMSDIQLQLVPHSHDPIKRSLNSALLPEVIFSAAYLSTKKDRRFAFQAKGKALDLRLGTDFVLPASLIQKSFAGASKQLRESSIQLSTVNTTPEAKRRSGTILGRKRFAWLAVDADFAGAVVHISPRQENQPRSTFGMLKGPSRSRAGRYLQAVYGDHAAEAVLQAPGIAIKVQYHDDGNEDPTLSTELKVAASSNTLYPSVVPLILDISSSIKELMGDESASSKPKEPALTAQQTTTRYLSEGTLEPNAILGRARLNAGLWIQRQEFSLSCQPIARVAATAKFEDIFLTVNTVQGPDHNRFFSILTTFNKLQTSVQHVYSRESTASFELDSIVVSLMNSKHVSGTTGISAIINVSPMKTDINAKQLQDFLLFREIWYPAELRTAKQHTTPVSATTDTQAFAIQRYQQIAAAGTLPWNAVVSVQELQMQVDFGPGLGKSTFIISKLWASSKKNSDAEQNLCIGFDKIAIESIGRMSGFIELANFRVRTSIRWPEDVATSTRAPLVQASVGFDHLRVKAVFEYQPFAVADISTFEAMMYNVRQEAGQNDRLVAMLNGGKVQAFCTTIAGAQGLALIQAFERLIDDKKEAFQASLRELDKHVRGRSVFPTATWTASVPDVKEKEESPPTRDSFSLHTDVVVALGDIDIGVFPNTFFDNQILKVQATDAQARFAVAFVENKIQSALGMRLGQVRVALSSINRPNTKALGEVSVPEVIERATSSRGGTILKVPRLVSSMQTWQQPNSNTIEYIFRSVFEGKVDVGWNYSRISFIRDMWGTHSRAFATRAGKPLPEPAVKITAEQSTDPSDASGVKKQEKITAVVNMPVSSNRFVYVAVEPPVIDTPQLRDMGEATPPLEWIGLHRDRLPEATHGVAIVTLLEVAKEVEDAYVRILGST